MSRHPRPFAKSRGFLRGVSVYSAVIGVVLAGALGFTSSNAGAATTVAQATGDFLSGTALSTDLANLIALQSASAVNTGSPATITDAHPLDVTALGLINLPLGGGLQLLGGLNPILDVGAANQFAQANNDGSSSGASGAVTDQGAISIGGPSPGPQGSATVNLNPVADSLGISNVLGNAQLSVDAVAGTAAETSAGVQSGAYGIANLTLDVTSPLVANVKTQLATVVSGAQALLDGLSTALSATLCLPPPAPCVIAVTPPDLQTTLDALTTVSLAGGSLVVDLDTGALQVNVDPFLAFHGIDLNGLAANTDLTALLHTLLAGDLTTGLTSTLETLVTDLTAAVNTTTITVAGIPVSAGELTAALAPIISQFTSGVQTIIDGLVPTVVDPVLTAVDQLAQVTVNQQATSGGTFIETALAIAVVSASPLATVNLGSASVGPNAGPAVPTLTSLDPTSGPTAGGQTVTITGAGFIPGATTVTIGGVTIAADQVTVAPDATSLTFSTPPHAAGPVDVTTTTAGGTSAPLVYTYVPPPTASSLTPTSGPDFGGQTVTITGTDFVPDATSVTIGGITVPANQVTVAPDGTTLTFSTPPHAAGPVDVTVTTPGGTTEPLAYTYVLVPAPSATALSPTSGPEAGGTTVTITGSDFVAGRTSVTIGGITVPADQVTVSPDGTSLTFVTPAHPPGPVEVTATTPAGTTAPLTFTYLPDAPVITSPPDGSVTGPTPPISGTGTPGDTVIVKDADGNVICTAVVDSTGHWSCTPTSVLEGLVTLSATQTDPGSGLTSAPSEPVQLQVRTTDLPATGAAAWSGLRLGVVLLVIGLVLLVLGSRRKPV